MSWDKNTLNYSDIPLVSRVLKILKEPYKVEIMGEVDGYGLNDLSGEKHRLHKLIFRGKVILEQMVRTHDCDCDDYIHSVLKNKEPKNWSLEVWVDEEE